MRLDQMIRRRQVELSPSPAPGPIPPWHGAIWGLSLLAPAFCADFMPIWVTGVLFAITGLALAIAVEIIMRSRAGQTSWRHLKRGSEYILVGRGGFQCADPAFDQKPITVYRAKKDGAWYARPDEEFFDGRFEVME